MPSAQPDHVLSCTVQIAVAGVVLSVVLALAALIAGCVYMSRIKKMDTKYSKYFT
jgi:hypothetical protein